MIKKDLPTLLKLRAEHNLDDEWFIDRVEEMMLRVIDKNDVLQGQRLRKVLGKGEK